MPTKRLLPALLAALLLAAPAAAAEHAPGFEACIKKNPKRSDQKQCLDMERDYWQKKLDARYQAMQGTCKKFSGPEAEKRGAACLDALEENQHSWLAYKASMRPVAENHPNSQSATENLAWLEIDQLRKRIHDLESLDPSQACPPLHGHGRHREGPVGFRQQHGIPVQFRHEKNGAGLGRVLLS